MKLTTLTVLFLMVLTTAYAYEIEGVDVRFREKDITVNGQKMPPFVDAIHYKSLDEASEKRGTPAEDSTIKERIANFKDRLAHPAPQPEPKPETIEDLQTQMQDIQTRFNDVKEKMDKLSATAEPLDSVVVILDEQKKDVEDRILKKGNQ